MLKPCPYRIFHHTFTILYCVHSSTSRIYRIDSMHEPADRVNQDNFL